MLHALEASEESFREEDSMWACDSLDDIKDKLHLLQLDLPWTTLIHPTTLHLCFTSSDPAPCIISSITISSDMQATVSLHGAPLPSVGEISLPHRMSSVRDIDQLMTTLQQLSEPNSQSQDTATAQTLLTLNLVLRLLSSVCVQSSKFFNALSFFHDQIALIVHNLSKNSMSYPSDFLVFSAMFYNVFPQSLMHTVSFETLPKLFCPLIPQLGVQMIRMLSVLKLTMNNSSISLSDFSIDWEDCDSGECNVVHILEPLTIDDVSSTDGVLPVVVYVAGYCCYSICKKLSCSDCKTLLTCAEGNVDELHNSYIQGISRGSL